MSQVSVETIKALVAFIARGLVVAETGQGANGINQTNVHAEAIDIYTYSGNPALTVSFRLHPTTYIKTSNAELYLSIDDFTRAGVLDEVRRIRERLPFLHKDQQLADLKGDLGI